MEQKQQTDLKPQNDNVANATFSFSNLTSLLVLLHGEKKVKLHVLKARKLFSNYYLLLGALWEHFLNNLSLLLIVTLLLLNNDKL